MNFNQLHTNFLSLSNRLDDMIIESIRDNEDELIDLNVSQLEKGIAADGLNIEPGYAYLDYAKGKKAQGSKAPLGVPDLKVESDFYSGIEIDSIQNGYTFIKSTDNKAGKLEKKYSSEIYGLTDKNKPIFSASMKESLLIMTRNELTK